MANETYNVLFVCNCLDCLCLQLLPSDDLITSKNRAYIEEAKTKAKKINSISLAVRLLFCGKGMSEGVCVQ